MSADPLTSLAACLEELNISGCPLGEAGVPTQVRAAAGR